MIKLYICCLVLITGSVEVGLDIDMKFHQEVMEIVSYDILSMKECSSADWNLKDTNVWGESAHYTKGM